MYVGITCMLAAG